MRNGVLIIPPNAIPTPRYRPPEVGVNLVVNDLVSPTKGGPWPAQTRPGFPSKTTPPCDHLPHSRSSTTFYRHHPSQVHNPRHTNP
ncbi:hypothetical protein HO173_003641 [Letharia columbiana]|uniref:Uncharacterized protein n=1 Tax=Letharia columbiana TaxID=112416 RepID=A0A8H6G0P6_9LECA|nr:uncharacterized protein HO173_003641 [Letharia columbiana]KAF6238361.1 hypothetical protein HO173_003641 [Letharia columbiana]